MNVANLNAVRFFIMFPSLKLLGTYTSLGSGGRSEH
jgi:hypothetical protein